MMVTVPLGIGAYKRTYAGEPEIRLENRFLEKNPANLRERVALISRCGSSAVNAFGGGTVRRTFSKKGLFGGDLFVVSGNNLWRYDGTNKTQIGGIINGNGTPQFAWMKGIGYEYVFISDGLLLQVYAGGLHATGTLTYAPGTITNQVIQIGGVYYSWNNAVDTNAPVGSAAHPWLSKIGTDPILAMANLLNFNGTRGTDFSTALGGPNPAFSAAAYDAGNNLAGTVSYVAPAVKMVVTSASVYADGNAISTTVVSGSYLSWGGVTLSGGGVHALSGVTVPDGQGVKALAHVSGFVLVGIVNSQKFYWVEPGAIIIDPLNFAEKESNPDNIIDMLSVGDQAYITGDGSTENWYATGDALAPFAPVQGRVYQRGTVDGTPVQVKDSVIIVGDDGIVYEIGYQMGTESQWGVHRISDHGIEERIRRQMRREQGFTP